MRGPVVADAVTLREFAESRRIDVLREAFTGTVHVPAAVRQELIESLPFAPEVRDVLDAAWLTWEDDFDEAALRDEVARIRRAMSRANDPQTKNLGEAQAVVLAREIGAALFCTDDFDAARLAEQRNITVIGTPDVLRETVAMGTLKCEEAVALYLQMQQRQSNWPPLGANDLCR